jgi:hypothetical protein
MRILILIVLMSACFASASFGQTVDPRLAGTWIIDKDYIKSRGDQTWMISVDGSRVSIRKIFAGSRANGELNLSADKRGETNSSANGRTVDSKSYWKDKKLIREYTYKVEGERPPSFLGPQYATARVTEMYYLSKDGNKLTFRRDDDSIWPNRNTPVKMGRAFEDKIVFRRKI